MLAALCGPLAAAADATATALETCPVTAPPGVLYETFSAFCRAHFGAEREPLVYDLVGTDLAFAAEGDWVHASATSAAIAFATNLPATTVVEFGTGTTLDRSTTASDRAYATHLHHLGGLEPGRTYRYRLVATDERGKVLRSEARTLTTAKADATIPVPGTLAGPPYVLDQAGATYRLTGDLTVPGQALTVIGDGITLDLDGHTLRFAEGATAAVDAGIRVRGSEKTAIRYRATGFRIRNGRIEQGSGTALSANTTHERFCPLVITGSDIDVAGLAIDWHGPQTWGLTLTHSGGTVDIHHNILTDRGGIIANRHGAGVRAIGFTHAAEGGNDFTIRSNLIRRTRQNGIGGATRMHHNEIYVDSCSINSFAIQPLSKPGVAAGDLHHNRIFGTGFNAYGFGWAHDDLTVRDNLVHFHGIMANSRWAAKESWGDLSTLEALRVTNYGKGGQVRNRLTYTGNLIVLSGGNGCELRGTGFFSDTTIRDLVFADNVVKVVSEDAQTTQVACIVAHGHAAKADALPVLYRDNTLMGNVCLIRFGDSYGKGHNHDFVGNRLLRLGERADFHAVAFDGGYSTAGHDFVDNICGPGVDLADVAWVRTGHDSSFAIAHQVGFAAPAGASLRIVDATGETVHQGTGPAEVVLTVATIHPPTWTAKTEAKGLSGSVVEARTPHRVVLEVGGAVHDLPVTISGSGRWTWTGTAWKPAP